MATETYKRLPRNVLPEEYNITLKPDLNTFDFEGSIRVKVKVHEATKTIKLDSEDLAVTNGTFELASGKVVIAKEIKELPEENRILFVFDEELPLGDGHFSCDFKGILNKNLRGFYRSKSKDKDGNDVFYAVTQFEPTDAHRAFPCWDEPAIKATFVMNLIVQKNFIALSNMDVVKETDVDNEWKRVEFNRTPKMSTYLVAVVVGNFDYLEDKSKNGVTVRIYTPLGKQEQGRYALDTAVRGLDFYEDYFKVAYPLPKADFIAIADFAAGAMENWGLITFREVALLYDPAHSSTYRKQRIAEIVTHELAHMWFGNLVTMEWWTYLWLNEGFARFMENFATDSLYPEYKVWNQFIYDALNEALSLDAFDNSHPIEVPVGHPAQVDEIFDSISYEKGASVVRMLENYIGTDKFKKGLQQYLSTHKYSNTHSSDLWKAIGDASGQSIDTLLDTWVGKIGFPLVSVTSQKDGNTVRLTLKQEKFFSSHDNPLRKTIQPLWKIPIDIAIGTTPMQKKTFLLENSSDEVVIENAADAAWFQINTGAVSFFRSMYTADMLQNFLPAIKDRTLDAKDRLILHADLFALVKSGYRNTTDILEFSDAFKNETDYSVWASIGECMGKLHSLLDTNKPVQAELHIFGRNLYRNIFNSLGWQSKPDDQHTTSLLRAMVLNKMVTFEEPEVLKEAKKRFDNHVSGTVVLPADLRSPVYRAVAKKMDDDIWEKFMKLHAEADLQEEQNRIVTALGAVPTLDYLQKVFDLAHSDKVRSQDSIYVIAAVSSSAPGRELAWNNYKENQALYNEKYKSGYLMSFLLKSIAEDFASFDKAKEVDAFFSTNAMIGTEMTTRQIVESIYSNAKWLQRDAEQIAKFFQKS